jgi:hypothetical protein
VVVVRRHHGGRGDLRLLRARARTLVLVAATVGFCCSCANDASRERALGSSAAAITNGTTTSGDLGVVALIEGGTLLCTATLVAPRVVLTAAHCVAGGAMPDAFFGSAPQSGAGTSIPMIATTTHPGFDPTTLTNDVAMALLGDVAPTGASPWPLPSAPLDSSSVGLPLRLVGFGTTGPSDSSPPMKRVGTTTLASLTATELTFGPSPSQTCTGDSGGPAFATIGGVESIVGVTSSGDPQCAQTAHDVRVDAYASFIVPWLQATAEGAAGPGDRCYYAANCAASAGQCEAALDDSTLSFCAPACGDGGACPSGLACLAGSDGSTLCRHPPPSPGAAGAPCAAASDCVDSSCVLPASGGGSVCATTCFPDIPGFCSSGTQCAAVAGDAGASACFPAAPAADSGRRGCSSAPGEARREGLALIVAAAVVARVRSRRRACADGRSRTGRGAP